MPKSDTVPTPQQGQKIDRELFLHTLERVQPGVATREILQQSSCFVFINSFVCSFNEDVSCRAKTQFPKEFQGAVQAGPFIEILRKIPDAIIEIRLTKKQLVVVGKNKETRITMEREITLPIESVEKPGEWKPLHPDFTEAVSIVQECASKDQSAFTFTCIHIHPKFMEACDNLQLTRYKIKTGVDESFLVRRDAIKHIPTFDFTKFSVTDNWIHFRTNGLILSCKKYKEKFEDLSHLLNVKGEPTVLPKALSEAAERCEVFSKENSDNNILRIKLQNGKMEVRGEGASGMHIERKKLKYEGKEMRFSISPGLLITMLKHHTDCEISKEHRLIVDGGKFRYIVCLEKDLKKTEGDNDGG